MAKTLTEVEREALALTNQDRARLAQRLIETLDAGKDEDVEDIWLSEAERRYEAYRKGTIKAVTAEEAFAEARSRLE